MFTYQQGKSLQFDRQYNNQPPPSYQWSPVFFHLLFSLNIFKVFDLIFNVSNDIIYFEIMQYNSQPINLLHYDLMCFFFTFLMVISCTDDVVMIMA